MADRERERGRESRLELLHEHEPRYYYGSRRYTDVNKFYMWVLKESVGDLK